MIKKRKMNNKKEKKNKRAITQLKAYFLIINMIIAIVSFGWMVNALSVGDKVTIGGTNYQVESIGDQIRIGQLDASGNLIPVGTANTRLYFADANALNARIASKAQPPPPATLIPTASSVGQAYLPGTEYNLAPGAKALSLQYTPAGQTTPVTLNEITSAKVLPDGTYEITHAGGKTIVPSTDGSGIIDKAKLQTPETLAKEKTTIATAGGQAIISNALEIGMLFGIGYLIGGFIGGNGNIALGAAFATAGFVWQASAGKWAGTFLETPAKWIGDIGKSLDFLGPGSGGIIIGAIVFALMYKKTSTEVVEFNCLPYQPPIGGADCEKCNDFEQCSEYSCKSLGQACQLLNAGTGQESCDWVNPHDVNSPIIEISNVLKGYKWVPDTAVRPPATGAVISQENGNCVKAFTPLEFTIHSNEPSQCKIDYNLTKGFNEMSYYIGGSNLYSYNHTEKMSLPSPSAINALDPELKNDGTYTLYVRCRDANGNFNQDAYSIRFCVEKGPDTTPPRIDGLSIPSNSPISYNTTSLYLEVYVNEPAQCKWSREDRDFAQMETNMSCNTNLWEINNNNVYTCRTTLTGIKDRQDNEYYFRCKDQPNALESERNPNVQSYLYNVIGTQPLNIIEIKPSNETIKGATDTIAVNLEVKTDNGYKNGEAFCYYTDTQTTDTTIVNKTCIGKEDSFILFAETGNISKHTQRQDLTTGDYTYYIKCVDLGGNAAYDCTKFSVEVDRSSPIIVRAYKESGQLKIITNEEADCSYSDKDCNFEIKDGIKMSTLDNKAHNAEWLITKNYYIRCNDKYNNQPNPNTCSAVIRPYKFVDKSNVIEL